MSDTKNNESIKYLFLEIYYYIIIYIIEQGIMNNVLRFLLNNNSLFQVDFLKLRFMIVVINTIIDTSGS